MIGRSTTMYAALLFAVPWLGGMDRPLRTTANSAPLSVSIAIPRSSEGRIIDIRQANSHFHVVVTNTSDRELRLWETWNSWGYFNLHFDVLDENGQVAYSIAKNQDVSWTANKPNSISIKPGEHFVLDVDWDRETWDLPFLKTPTSQGVFKLKLRASFEIIPDADSKQFGIWTGKIESDSDDYELRYWR